MNKTLTKNLDGTYSRLLRYALNVSWKDHVTNDELHKNIKTASVELQQNV